MADLTKPQRAALSLLRAWKAGLSARAFAAAAYPEAFQRTSATGRSGKGQIRGAGAALKAGAFLRRLYRLGLVDAEVARESGLVTYRVSQAGLDALDRRNEAPPPGEDPVVLEQLKRWRP